MHSFSPSNRTDDTSSLGQQGEPTVLPQEFFESQTALVARELLGKVVRVWDEHVWRSGVIVETEAYVDADPANHAFRGPNRRNQSMFKGPGTVYVYVVHGVHCVNAVTRRGEAVLIRAVQPLQNLASSTNGPGKLCRALHITRSKHDGLSLLGPEIQIVENDFNRGCFDVGVSGRIGVSKAKDLPLRFFINANQLVSHWRKGGESRRQTTQKHTRKCRTQREVECAHRHILHSLG